MPHQTRCSAAPMVLLCPLLVAILGLPPAPGSTAFAQPRDVAAPIEPDRFGVGQPLSPPRPDRPVVWMDYHHHRVGTDTIGRLLVSGSYTDPIGRYGLTDVSHSNSFAPLIPLLDDDFALVPRLDRFTPEALADTDIVWMFTPDAPDVDPDVNVISDEQIDTLEAFVRDGGTLLLMANGFAELETFETQQFHKLLLRMGIDWRELDTGHPEWRVGPSHPWFYDMGFFHYGGGTLFTFTDDAERPEVMLTVGHDPDFTDVAGNAIVMTRPGQGKCIAIGDTGSFTANLDRPWTDNGTLIRQVFDHARPSGAAPQPSYPDRPRRYRIQSTTASVQNFRMFQRHNPEGIETLLPRDFTPIPYRDRSATLTVQRVAPGKAEPITRAGHAAQGRHLDLTITRGDAELTGTLALSRLGETHAWTQGNDPVLERWPDLLHLAVFMPHDALRIGDRFTKKLRWSAPSINTESLTPFREIEAQGTLHEARAFHGRAAVMLRYTGWALLDELGLDVEDLLPRDGNAQLGLNDWQIDRGGGRLLIQREQTIAAETGELIRVVARSRVILFSKRRDADDRAAVESGEPLRSLVVPARQTVITLLPE